MTGGHPHRGDRERDPGLATALAALGFVSVGLAGAVWLFERSRQEYDHD